MRLLEIKGDLFASTDSLAHCVSEDLRMGKGIATTFSNKFGQVDNLINQNKKTGQVAYITDPTTNRIIFYLITKPRYFEKPEYSSLYESLVELRELCVKLNVKAVSMPKIGCGLDKLEWDMVKMYLNNVFGSTDITITIYTL